MSTDPRRGPGPAASTDDERLRRAAVLELLARRPGRGFAPTLSVGDPRGRRACFVDVASREGRRRATVPADHALRCDVVGALLGEALAGLVDAPPGSDRPSARPLTWLARPAGWDDPDCEHAWLAAAAGAHAELGVPLAFVVVTRDGWRDPVTGESRTWRRLRPRS